MFSAAQLLRRSAFVLVALSLLALVGCGGAQAGPRRFAVMGHPLPVVGARFAFATEAPRLFHTRTGAFTRPLVIDDGVVVLSGRRTGRLMPLRTEGFRGRRQLIINDGERHVQFQYDAPFDALPVVVGEHVRLKALTLSEADRLAFGIALWDQHDNLRAIAMRASSPGALPLELLGVAGWQVALGDELEHSEYCGAVMSTRMVVVTAPDGRPAHVHPGYRYSLEVEGARWTVDVGAATTVEGGCPDAAGERDFSVLIRREGVVAEEPSIDERLAAGYR